jgi:DNA-binding transcriptional MerR regulator
MIEEPEKFRTIRDVSTELGESRVVLQYWERCFKLRITRSPQRRYYRPEDVATLLLIRKLIRVEGFTHRGVKRVLNDPLLRARHSPD